LGGKPKADAISGTPDETINEAFVVGTDLNNFLGLCEWICVYTYCLFMACP
jgi:hypothetical protein